MNSLQIKEFFKESKKKELSQNIVNLSELILKDSNLNDKIRINIYNLLLDNCKTLIELESVEKKIFKYNKWMIEESILSSLIKKYTEIGKNLIFSNRMDL